MSTQFDSGPFEAAARRGVCYNRVGQLLLSPDEELFQRLADGSLVGEVEEVRRAMRDGTCSAEADVALGELRREAGRALAAGLPALIRGYDRTFGHAAAVDHTPYEAHYAAAHLFQQTHELADVCGFYRAFGVDVSAAAHQRPDHVGIELEFFGFLCLKEANAISEGVAEQAEITREAQRRFLGEHLGGFLPTLNRRIAGRARSAFHCAALRFAAALVEEDCLRLSVPPEERRRHRFTAEPAPTPDDGDCFGSPLVEIETTGVRE